MGAGQSSSDNPSPSTSNVRTSYYDLLALPRTATDLEIKKAYRQKALELHPDRNYGNEAAATQTFAEIQAAYEVLSDPQERAWYDSHESAILRGEDGYGDGTEGGGDGGQTFENVSVTSADALARMMRQFRADVAFDDSPSGFYGYVKGVFEHLALEEEIAARMSGEPSAAKTPDYPSFGSKSSPYSPNVRNFYAAWSNFGTLKSFAWRDRYRLSDAPDRYTRRRMEERNRSFRNDARREFNDAVRTLVAFLRKRDPRVAGAAAFARSEQERLDALREAAREQGKRARAENAARLAEEKVPEWARSRVDEEGDEEDGLVGEVGGEEDEEESEVEEVFECVACDKVFKSEKQWFAHEKSRKHQKALFALKKRMRKEGRAFDLDEVGEEGGDGSGVATPEVKDGEDAEEDGDEQDILDDVADEVEDHAARENGHTPGNNNDDYDDADDDNNDYDDDEDKDEDDHAKNKPLQDRSRDDDDDSKDQEGGNAKEPSNPPVQQADEPTSSAHGSDDSDDASSSSSTSNSDYASPSTIAARLTSATLETPPNLCLSPSDDETSNNPTGNGDGSGEAQPRKKVGKAAQKRAKKAAAAASAATDGQGDEEKSSEFRCGVCQAGFPSKTRLFQHIRDQGHAVLKSVGSGAGAGAGAGSGGKGGKKKKGKGKK